MVTEVTGNLGGVARSTSRDDKKISGSRGAERAGRVLLRSVRMDSTRVREDLSSWSSLLSSAVSSANEVPRETRRAGTDRSFFVDVGVLS